MIRKSPLSAWALIALLSGAPLSEAVAGCDPATNAARVAEAREAISRMNAFSEAVRLAGYRVPPALSSAIGRFTKAAEMGVDLAEAAGEAEYQVLQIVNNKHRLCEEAGLPEEDVDICKLKIDRVWQARNVNAVLNWNNTGSVIRRVVNKWFGDRCSRNDEGGVSIDLSVKGSAGDLDGVRGKVLKMQGAR